MYLKKIISVFMVFLFMLSCSSDDDNTQPNETATLVGSWLRLNTVNQNGNVTDDSDICKITEFTQTEYTVTTYMNANCTDEYTVATLPYTRVDEFIYFGEVSANVRAEIIELTGTTLKLKNVFSEEGEPEIYDIVTYSRQ